MDGDGVGKGRERGMSGGKGFRCWLGTETGWKGRVPRVQSVQCRVCKLRANR